MADDKKKRPKHRTKTLGTAVDDDTYDRFQEKAKSQDRTSAGVLRSLIMGWLDDEAEAPKRDNEDKRAPKRKK
jgi:hypothetical protein